MSIRRTIDEPNTPPPVDADVVNSAICLIVRSLNPEIPEPIIAPTNRGGLQIEWHANGVDMEIYFDIRTGPFFWAESAGSGEGMDLPVEGNEALLQEWFTRLKGGRR